MKLKLSVDVSEEQIANLLVCAFEGGSNYWYQIDYTRSVAPPNPITNPLDLPSDVEASLARPEDPPRRVCRYVVWPLSEGGRLFVTNGYGDPYEGYLDLTAIERGLKIMAERHPKAFHDLLTGNEDANTGDTFLQCAVFGEEIYG